MKLGYGIFAKIPPPDSDAPWDGTPTKKATKTMVISSGVVAPSDVEQFMDDAIMWLC